jgi:subtilisin family serine protease
MRFKTNVLYLVLSSFLVSCSNSKSNETVFPTQVAQGCGELAIKNQYIVGWEDGSYSIEKADSEGEFRETFVKKHLNNIRYIDRDIKIKIEPFASDLVHVNEEPPPQWQVDKVNARKVWAQGFQGQNVIVGVVDGMVDSEHIQLKNNVSFSKQINVEINDPDKNVHGTHVAGIIAADPSLGLASGIAPRSKIAAAQFIDNDGAGSIGEAILAMNEVAAAGAKIINFSWGGAPCVENLKTAVNSLSDSGILIVTASGNERTNSDSLPSYPAAFMFLNQINVAASGLDDLLTDFSNYGVRTVQLAAPGKSILSTIPGNKVRALDGTSMSAPIVSGAAALLLSAVPESNAQQIRSALMTTVDHPNGSLNIQSGGRINVQNALIKLKQIVLK